MTPNPSRTARQDARNEAIRKRFTALWKKGFRDEWISQKLSEEFFLSDATILAIVFRWGPYRSEKPAKIEQPSQVVAGQVGGAERAPL